MVEVGEDLALAAQPPHDVVAVHAAAQDLDRHPALEGAVGALRLVDRGHAAAADLAHDPVRAGLLRRPLRRGRTRRGRRRSPRPPRRAPDLAARSMPRFVPAKVRAAFPVVAWSSSSSSSRRSSGSRPAEKVRRQEGGAVRRPAAGGRLLAACFEPLPGEGIHLSPSAVALKSVAGGGADLSWTARLWPCAGRARRWPTSSRGRRRRRRWSGRRSSAARPPWLCAGRSLRAGSALRRAAPAGWLRGRRRFRSHRPRAPGSTACARRRRVLAPGGGAPRRPGCAASGWRRPRRNALGRSRRRRSRPAANRLRPPGRWAAG